MVSLSKGRPPVARQALDERAKHEQDENEKALITKRGYWL